jgi:hypothetical protein
MSNKQPREPPAASDVPVCRGVLGGNRLEHRDQPLDSRGRLAQLLQAAGEERVLHHPAGRAGEDLEVELRKLLFVAAVEMLACEQGDQACPPEEAALAQLGDGRDLGLDQAEAGHARVFEQDVDRGFESVLAALVPRPVLQQRQLACGVELFERFLVRGNRALAEPPARVRVDLAGQTARRAYVGDRHRAQLALTEQRQECTA